ncbi:MAG: aminoglycoside phosphotransferase family protein, partial [Acidimicrobiia bacterium]|nr:aminoglycoside phosphotransferase family protein [Acidimicrobiia bacterium]
SGLAWPASYPTPFEDDDEPPEAPLPAGGLTPAVRVGETVRRGVGPWTPAVHALLDHLHQVGFVDAPRALGIDRRGREVLSFVTGEVGAAVRSPGRAGDEALVAVGRWLRRYHDAVSTFEPPPDASWQRLLGTPDGSVVGHGDISVANVVVGPHGGSVALIDWDLAVPSTALWDVAYAAWRLVPLVDDPDLAPIGWPAPVDRPMRLRLLVEAYGLDPADRRRLLEVVAQRQRSVTETIRAWGGEGVPGWRDLLERGVAEGPLRDIRFLEANRDEWRSALV